MDNQSTVNPSIFRVLELKFTGIIRKQLNIASIWRTASSKEPTKS
jgi:hypothetical protein